MTSNKRMLVILLKLFAIINCQNGNLEEKTGLKTKLNELSSIVFPTTKTSNIKSSSINLAIPRRYRSRRGKNNF